jgi:hypothetical protein
MKIRWTSSYGVLLALAFLLWLPIFMFAIFMFPMFMLSCAFAFELAGLTAGLGDDMTFAFELALLFEFSAVVHAAAKTGRANNVRRPIVRRISVPPMYTDARGNADDLLIVRVSSQLQ